MRYSDINFEAEKSNARRFALLALALLASLAVTHIEIFFEFDELDIKDRKNYHAYERFVPLEMLPTDHRILISEPVFFYIYSGISAFFQGTGRATKLIIFSSSLVYFYIILLNTRIPFFWRLIVCLFPWGLVNYIMTLRQGVASLVIFLHLIIQRRIPLYAWLVGASIHYAFFILASISFATTIIYKINISRWLKVGIISSLIAFVILPVLAVLSRWQIEGLPNYFGFNYSSIGLAFPYWLTIFIIFILQGKSFIDRNLIAVVSPVLYVLLVPFFPAVSRIMQIMAIFIIFAGFQLTGIRLIVFKFMLLLHVGYFLFGIASTQSLPGMVI